MFDSQVENGKFVVLAVYNYTDFLPGLNLFNVYAFEELMKDNYWKFENKYIDTQVTEECFLNNENCSDILYYSGHGINTALHPDLAEEYEFPDNSSGVVVPVKDSPKLALLTYNNFGTMDDYKWIIFNSCEVVNNENSYLHRVFTYDSSSAHAILGFNEIIKDVESNIRLFIDYLFGINGEIQTSVWRAWKCANLEVFPEQWSAFFLEGAKDEVITNPVNYITDYDVWYADVVNLPAPVIPDPSDPPLVPNPNPNPLPITASMNLDGFFTGRVIESLCNGKVILNYKKPTKKQVYSLRTISEVSNSQSVESEFYSNNRFKLPGLFYVKKINYTDKIQYKTASENVLYHEPTGAVVYQKNVSTTPINKNLEEAIIEAEDFINDFGGGLPRGAKLDKVYGNRIKNLRTGETKYHSYILHYSVDYAGVKFSGPGTDGILIEVTEEGISYYRRLLRAYSKNTSNTYTLADIIDEKTAFKMNAENISSRIRTLQPIVITEVNLVYKSSKFNAAKNYVAPAWEYKEKGGLTFYINAISGKIITY